MGITIPRPPPMGGEVTMVYIHYHDENQQNILSPEGMVLKQIIYT